MTRSEATMYLYSIPEEMSSAATSTRVRSVRTHGLILVAFGLHLVCGSLAYGSATPGNASPDPDEGKARLAESYGKVPLSFEPNRGQTSSEVQWVARGAEYALFLSGHDAVLELNSIKPKKGITDTPQIDSAAVRMNLLGAKAVKDATGEEAQPGKANYFTGRDASKWLSEVPMFGKVRLHEVYPGIDLVYYGKRGRLEYDFVVSPGADSAKIGLQFEGAKATLAANGDLVLPVNGSEKEVRFDKPTVYQMKDGVRQRVNGAFHVASDGKVSFAVGAYDRRRELVIDPSLIFAGAIATGNQQTIPTGMVVDRLGEMVITGYTNDLTFPVTTGALQTNCQTYSADAAANGFVRCGPSSSTSGFVTKLSADGASLIYSTYLHGGGGAEQGHSVAVDAAGDAYILGSTSSNDFPVTSNAYQSLCQPTYSQGAYFAPVLPITSQCDNFHNGGGTEYTVNGPTLFIAELNPSGTALIYSTFFGGSASVYPVGIALDAAGNMIFASGVNQAQSASNLYPNSTSLPFPTTTSGYQTTGINVYTPALSKLSADGQTLMYSTFLGSQALNVGHDSYNQALALGQNGVAFLGGFTDTSDFPTTAGSFKPTCGLNTNDITSCFTNQGFVAAIDTTKSGAASLVYASYLGGEAQQGSNIPEQEVYGLAADASNNLFVTGYTYANDFPSTAGVYQPHCNDVNPTGTCQQTAFLSKVNPTGTVLTWSTLLGDTRDDGPGSYGASIAFDTQGQVYLYGLSQDGSGDFPLVNPISSYTGGNKVFLATFSADATQLLFSTRFSGPSNNSISLAPIANGLTVDAAGNMYIAGYSGDGGSFGTTAGTYSTTATSGFNRPFFAKISPMTLPSPSNGLTGNLLANPGGELGSLADWTSGGNGTPQVDSGTYDPGINPHTGSYDFVGGYSSPGDTLSQTVSIIQQGITAAQVDGGTLFANVSFWEQGLNQGDPSDDGSVTLTFRDTNNTAISTVTIGPEDSHNGTWFNMTGMPPIPVGTRSITYTMNFIRNQLTDNDAFFDDNVLSIHTNTGLTIFPGTLHFGNVAVGSRSAPQTVSVTNQGTTAISIEQVASELGANPADFVQTNNCPTDPAVLVAGASCQITVTFVPGGVGYKLAGIDLPDDTPPTDQSVRVDGTATGGILQVNPGNLKTIAGTGVAGTTGNGGPATAAELNQPNGVAFDPSGNLYIADGAANVVRKVDTAGNITTFAGVGTGGFTGDGGPATQAELLDPSSVTSDKNGNIYIQDTLNFVIRKVDTSGTITTFAGTPQTPGHSGDGGPATAAKFNQNQGARFDSAGNLFVPTCRGASIRKIDTAGNISTVAGDFTEGYSGDGGPAINAQLQCPSGVAIDAAGNFYIADTSNNVIRKVNTQGNISTIAGSTAGTPGAAGDGGAATAALLNLPNDVALDAAGNLYIADSANNRIRKIDTNGIITTAAGGLNYAGSAAVNTPLGLTTDAAGNVYFSDSGNSAVREILPQGVQPFPATQLGSTAPAQSLTLSNIGNTDVTLATDGAFSTSGNAGDFALSAGTCTGATVLAANGGSCALSITFTPTVVGQRALTVMISDNALNTPQSFSIGGTGTAPAGQQATPTITWAMPAAITTATPLSAAQLDAAATDANGAAVPGTYVYAPGAGTLLAPGTQTLSVTFTPTDSAAFVTATKTVSISVTQAAGVATTTALTVTSGNSALTTVAVGTVVALKATVTAGTTPIAPGLVAFCDATAASCTDTHLLGTAQLLVSQTGMGTATYRFVPGIGAHSYKAVFLGTAAATGSASGPAALAVTGTYPTATAIAQSGTAGNYTLTATTVGTGSSIVAPTGTVSFLDTSNANAVLGSSPLGASTAAFSLAQATGSPNAVGGGAYGVATGDFNGDGFADVVVENYYAGTVSVLLGKGDGTFQAQSPYAVGGLPERVLVADMNGDGALDLVVANTGSSTISVLLGKGDGTFQNQVTYLCGSPVGLGVMDINHDGVPDVVAGDYYSNTISVLLGRGDGTLQTAVTYATGSTPQTVAEGDFNGDGNVDVAVGNEGGASVGVFLGKGDGTFQTMVTYPVGNSPQGLQVGDFNGDGKQDLAVANQVDGTVSVLLGNGDGTFQGQVTYPVGVQPVGIAVADFNGDGIEDITVGNTGQESLTEGVLLGKGDGTFQAQVTFPTGNFPYGVGIADFNGDGLPDLAVANFSDATATILLSQVTETATATLTGVSPTGPGSHAVLANYPGDAHYSASVSQATTLTGIAITPVITWTPAVSAIPYGTALGSSQLNATAATLAGVAIPGTFVYTPAAGTVLQPGTQTLSVVFTPTDAVDYTTATASVSIVVGGPTLILLTPAGASIGTKDTMITLTGTGFLVNSVVRVNGAAVTTTYINPTTLMAVVPATYLAQTGTLQIAVADGSIDAVSGALAFAVVPVLPAVALTGPSTTPPGSQPSVGLTISNPYPLPLTAAYSLSFAGATTPATDDPSVQFSNGRRFASYTVAANSTAVPAVDLQAGTIEGTITIAVTLTSDGVDVTPAGLAPLVIQVPAVVPVLSGTTVARSGTTLTVVVHGFSNTREVSQAKFEFTPATGSTLTAPDLTLPATTIFSDWYGSAASGAYGSTFTYTQIFNTSDEATNVSSVKVTLTNSVGDSTAQTSQ